MIEIKEDFFKGIVLDINERAQVNEFGHEEGVRTLTVETADRGLVEVEQAINLFNESDNVPVEIGSQLVLVETQIDGLTRIDVQESYRFDGILILFAVFIALVAWTAGKKGLQSIIGLGISLFVIVKWLIPQILAGQSPILVSFVGAAVIAAITFYLSHGFQKKTTIALFSTFITLVLAFLFSKVAVSLIKLSGAGSEEAISLTFGNFTSINLQGLFLGAIVIGTLGILDDVTITQVSAVKELHKANKKLGVKDLFKKGFAIGKDHIASVVNTLVLAYAGASFPVLIVLVTSGRPFWVTANSEFMAEEIVRTLVGSMTLLVAIPMATFLAAHYYSKS